MLFKKYYNFNIETILKIVLFHSQNLSTFLKMFELCLKFYHFYNFQYLFSNIYSKYVFPQNVTTIFSKYCDFNSSKRSESMTSQNVINVFFEIRYFTLFCVVYKWMDFNFKLKAREIFGQGFLSETINLSNSL